MRHLVYIFAFSLLVMVLSGMAWVLYAYISISTDDQIISECAEQRVAPLEIPPEPASRKVQVDVKEQKICTKIPEVRGFKITMKNQCTVVARTPIFESREPSSDELDKWQSAVAEVTETWRAQVEITSKACAEEARKRMKDEIQYWSSVMSGPAPYLIGLIGFVTGISLTRIKKGRKNA